MKNRIISIIITVVMTFSALGQISFAADDNTISPVVLEENFNSYSLGEIPSYNMDVKMAGGAEVAVVNVPDSTNKSLCISCVSGGEAYVQKGFSAPTTSSQTLNFRFKSDSAASFKLVKAVDSKGNYAEIFELANGSLTHNGETFFNLENGHWYTVSITLNAKAKTASVSIDGKKYIKKQEISIKDISALRIQLSDVNVKINIDDITLMSADAVAVENHTYYPGSGLYLPNTLQAEANDISSVGLLLYRNSKKAIANGMAVSVNAAPESVDKIMYIPVRFVAEHFGAEVQWNDEEQAAFIVMNDTTYKLKSDKSQVCNNGTLNDISYPVITRNGSLMMAAADIAGILGEELLLSDGLVMIGGEQELYLSAESRVQKEVKNMVKYIRPTGEQLMEKLSSTHGGAHPRIHLNSAEVERIKALIQTDERANKMFQALKSEADTLLTADVATYTLVGDGNLGKEDEKILERPKLLAFVWMLTGDDAYAERAWEELEAACTWPNWNHLNTFLDTSHMFAGVAIGYDWLYNYLSPERRKLVSDALVAKGLNPVMDVYKGVYNSSNCTMSTYFWVDDEYNWNVACNYATLAACFALAEEYPTLCKEASGYAIHSYEYHLGAWEPDGAWTEGPDYGYVTLNMDAQMMSMLESALGDSFGYSTSAGLLEASDYFKYIMGPTGFFNYSDGNKQTHPEYSYSFYMAKHLNDTSMGYYRARELELTKYNTSPEEMIWYRPELVGATGKSAEKDAYFRGAETTTMRSSWHDDAIFAGFHAHDNAAPHGHLDVGEFVYESFGQEWFKELGYDTFSYESAGSNFVTYRSRAEGHNTLVMDDTPYKGAQTNDDGMLKYYDVNFDAAAVGEIPADVRTSQNGESKIEVVEDEENSANRYLQFNLSDAAAGTSVYVQRTFTEPYVKSKVKFSFKMRFSDFNWLSETHGSEWKFPELDSSDRQGLNFPVYLTPNGFYAVSPAGAEQILAGAKPGVWYKFDIVIDAENDTYGVDIDGGITGGKGSLHNLEFSKEMEDIFLLRIQLDKAKTVMDIDDISISLDPSEQEMGLTSSRQFDQNRVAVTTIDKFESTPYGTFAISDMTDAYYTWADSAKRGVMLTDERRAFVVRDEVKLKGKTDVYWFAHMASETNVKIAEDGKSAIINKNGHKLWVGFLSDTDAKFEIMQAKPMNGSPNPSQQYTNDEFKKLAVKYEGVTEVNMSIAMIPLLGGETVPGKLPANSSIDDWQLPQDELPKLDSIMVDGKALEGFDSDTNTYDILLPDGTTAAPVVSASATGADVTVNQASQAPGFASITVKKDGVTSTYILSFRVREVLKSTIQGYTITEDDITVSEYQSAGYEGRMTIDGDFDTRWVSEGREEWIMYDFRQAATLGKIDIAWYNGVGRYYQFEVQMSDDGVNWRTVYAGESSSTTAEYETYNFGIAQTGRYLRIFTKGHKEETGIYNNIAEVR